MLRDDARAQISATHEVVAREVECMLRGYTEPAWSICRRHADAIRALPTNTFSHALDVKRMARMVVLTASGDAYEAAVAKQVRATIDKVDVNDPMAKYSDRNKWWPRA